MQTEVSFKECSIETLETMAKQLQLSLEMALECDSYQDSISGIKEQCKRVLCRAQEWKSKAFLIIVVGPVKSGKSTFVNLLAHEKVSPTHFLECTVRPSIISKKKDENTESLITTFITKGNPTMEHVDTIIDYIKGLEFADLGQIKEEIPCLLTDENLDSKVSYRIGLENMENGKVALTSITTKGGEFLQDNIFLIDMPGFDGVLANLDQPFYEAIINRADLVVFVQSSNSAINKISENFCKMISNRNGSIPIYLIHNYFDSVYWHTEEDKEKVKDGNIKKALEFFKEQKMIVPKEYCKCINLGKVTDARNTAFRNDPERFLSGYDEMLESEDTLFSEMEHELYKKISSTQNRTRLLNCISRTVSEVEILRNLLENRKRVLQYIEAEYNRISDLFDTLRRNTKPVGIASALSLKDKETILIDKLKDIKKEFCKSINLAAKYNTEATRIKARDLIRIYKETTKSFIDGHFNPSTAQQSIQINSETTFISSLQPELKTYNSLLEEIQLAEENIEFDYSPIEREYDVEKRIEKWYTRTRKGGDVVDCMTDIEHTLFGLSSENPCGFIPQQFYPTLQKEFKTWIIKIANSYYESYIQKVSNTKTEVLKSIITNISVHKEEIKKIEELENKINTILKSINLKNNIQ